MYDFQRIKHFNSGPMFPELKDMTVGELNATQGEQAHEDWIRAQFGHMEEYYRPHLALLLHIIDKQRAVIDEVNAWAVCACIASPEDMAQNFPRIEEITNRNSSALRASPETD